MNKWLLLDYPFGLKRLRTIQTGIRVLFHKFATKNGLTFLNGGNDCSRIGKLKLLRQKQGQLIFGKILEVSVLTLSLVQSVFELCKEVFGKLGNMLGNGGNKAKRCPGLKCSCHISIGKMCARF